MDVEQGVAWRIPLYVIRNSGKAACPIMWVDAYAHTIPLHVGSVPVWGSVCMSRRWS